MAATPFLFVSAQRGDRRGFRLRLQRFQVFTMLSIRAALTASRRSSPRKIGPHTGMSLAPWAVGGRRSSPLMSASTLAAGNVPWFRWASVVRSGGGTLRADATCPPPFPSRPWHDAQ